MKLSTICCVLTGFLIAVPLSNRSPLRVLSVNESSSVRGAQFGGINIWTKCGTAELPPNAKQTVVLLTIVLDGKLLS